MRKNRKNSPAPAPIVGKLPDFDLNRRTRSLLEKRMARHEADREDLFAEAVGLTRRVEGRLVKTDEVVLIGLRSNGWLSVYFGPEPMYQFDVDGRIRRAWEQGALYRSQGTTLAKLTRSRSAAETTLSRTDLTPDELGDFRHRMIERIRTLTKAMESYGWRPLRQAPTEDVSLRFDLVTRLQAALIADPWLAPAITRR